MSERLSTFEKRVVAPTATILSFLALSGCSTTKADMQEFTPIQRLAYDYVENHDFDDYSGSECLKSTAFDVNSGYYGRASYVPPVTSYDHEADTLILTASNGKELSFKGFEQYYHTVEPANPESEAIFVSYGCEVTDY